MTQVFDRIAVIGVGLIGASVARGAAEFGAAGSVALYDASEAARARLRELKIGVVFDDAQSAVANADLVVLATPVGAMGYALEAAAPGLKPGSMPSTSPNVPSRPVPTIYSLKKEKNDEEDIVIACVKRICAALRLFGRD